MVNGPCLYGFVIDCALEKATLVHMLYLHKKTSSYYNI